jgi:hypothetical protein
MPFGNYSIIHKKFSIGIDGKDLLYDKEIDDNWDKITISKNKVIFNTKYYHFYYRRIQ